MKPSSQTSVHRRQQQQLNRNPLINRTGLGAQVSLERRLEQRRAEPLDEYCDQSELLKLTDLRLTDDAAGPNRMHLATPEQQPHLKAEPLAGEHHFGHYDNSYIHYDHYQPAHRYSDFAGPEFAHAQPVHGFEFLELEAGGPGALGYPAAEAGAYAGEEPPPAVHYYPAAECGRPEVLRVDYGRPPPLRPAPCYSMAGCHLEPQSQTDSGHVSSVSLGSLEAIHNNQSSASLLSLTCGPARQAHSAAGVCLRASESQVDVTGVGLEALGAEDQAHYYYHHHEQQHQEPELKVCEWEGCGNTFLDMQEFVKHLEEKHVNQGPKVKNRYFCLWANCKRNEQEFNARYKLLIHMRVHSGEKPYPCNNENCKKSFSRLENLKIHVRSHTGEKPYKCSYERCAKSFTNSSDRIKHHKTHKDPKPYSCNYNGCPKRYTDPSSLRKHLRAHKKAQLPAPVCAPDFDPTALLAAGPSRGCPPPDAPLQQQHCQLSRSWSGRRREARAAEWLEPAAHEALNRSLPAPGYAQWSAQAQFAQPPQQATPQPQPQQQAAGCWPRAGSGAHQN